MQSLFVFVVLVVSLSATSQEDDYCTGQSASRKYDLSSFGGFVVNVVENEGFWSYSASICANSVECINASNRKGFCSSSTSGSFSVGKFTNVVGGLEDGSDGARVYFKGGDAGRFGYVAVRCNPSVTGPEPANIVAQSPKTTSDPYVITMEHAVGCGKPINDCSAFSARNYYNLATLAGQTFTAQDSEGFWSYSLSICSNSIQCGGQSQVGFCQESTSGTNVVGYFVGAFGDLENGGDGVRVSYAGGSGGRFGTAIVGCNPRVTGKPVNVTVIQPRTVTQPFIMTMKHADGCPKPH